MADNPYAAYLAANPNAKEGDSFSIGGQSFTFGAAALTATDKALGIISPNNPAASGGSSEPPNKKIPESAAQTKEPDHPVYLFMETDTNGRMKGIHRNPNKPNDSYEVDINHDGSYKTKEISDGYNGIETSHTHHERKNAGSSSNNTDGNVDVSNQSTENRNTKGDSGGATGGIQYEGSTKKVGGSQEGNFDVVPGGKSFISKDGDSVVKLTGDQHTSITGDKVDVIVGNKMNIVDGEFGINVQGGNYDLQLDSGKARIKAGNDILIDSDTKITLKVGSSTIVIDSSSITITSAAVNFVKA
jgi:hypothetical protein